MEPEDKGPRSGDWPMAVTLISMLLIIALTILGLMDRAPWQ